MKKERHERSYPYPATKTIYDRGNLDNFWLHNTNKVVEMKT